MNGHENAIEQFAGQACCAPGAPPLETWLRNISGVGGAVAWQSTWVRPVTGYLGVGTAGSPARRGGKLLQDFGNGLRDHCLRIIAA